MTNSEELEKYKQSSDKLPEKLRKQPQSSLDKILSFLSTFAVVFAITVAIGTPLMRPVAKIAEIIDSNPGGVDAPVLAMDLDYLIPTDSPFFEAFTNANRVNILLLGVDENNLTDTILLTSFDMDQKHLDMIWIPRDTYYFRGPGYPEPAQHKINAVYRKNPVNTAKAVSEILMDIPINYYALVPYSGAAAIVDAMNGIPMNIPFHMRYIDPLDTPPLDIDIPAGEQILYGEQAVKFLRFRKGMTGYPGYPEGDLGRVKAQQEFVKNAFRQCLSFDLPKIATTAYSNITSDIKLGGALYLASKAAGINAEDIRAYTLPGYADPNPPYFIFPDAKKTSEILIEIYSLDRELLEETGRSNGAGNGAP